MNPDSTKLIAIKELSTDAGSQLILSDPVTYYNNHQKFELVEIADDGKFVVKDGNKEKKKRNFL